MLDRLPTYVQSTSRQSGFRPGHSVEAAILRVIADILAALDGLDRGELATLPPWSFRTCRRCLIDTAHIDHNILIEFLMERLRRSLSVFG
jgi:hypothetical protein